MKIDRMLDLVRVFVSRDIDFTVAWLGEHECSQQRALLLQLSPTRELSANKTASLIQFAWSISPALSLQIFEICKLTPACTESDVATSALKTLMQVHPLALRRDWRGVTHLITCSSSISPAMAALHRHGLKDKERSEHVDLDLQSSILNHLATWAPAPAYAAIGLLNRTLSSSSEFRNGVHDFHLRPLVVQYAVRSLEQESVDVLQFYLPQLVQLLRQDYFGVLSHMLCALAAKSPLICHQLVWLLEVESVTEDEGGANHNHTGYGLCRQLAGVDPLPQIASSVLQSVKRNLSPAALHYLSLECSFFNKITAISGLLKTIPNKELHNGVIAQQLSDLSLREGDGLYMPTDPYKRVVEVVVTSGIPMQSAAKCPFLLVFKTREWAGPDSIDHTTNTAAAAAAGNGGRGAVSKLARAGSLQLIPSGASDLQSLTPQPLATSASAPSVGALESKEGDRTDEVKGTGGGATRSKAAAVHPPSSMQLTRSNLVNMDQSDTAAAAAASRMPPLPPATSSSTSATAPEDPGEEEVTRAANATAAAARTTRPSWVKWRKDAIKSFKGSFDKTPEFLSRPVAVYKYSWQQHVPMYPRHEVQCRLTKVLMRNPFFLLYFILSYFVIVAV